MKQLLSAITVILLLSSAVLAQTDKRSAAIRKVMDEQAGAWNRGDIEGFMQGYWRSEKLVFVSGDNVTRGWQQTHDRYKRSYDTRSKMGPLTFSDLEINVLSKDAAVVIGSWSLKREKDNPHGKFTLLFRKIQNQGWRVVIDHTS